MRVKIKGYIQNINDNTYEYIDTKAIQNKNSLIYTHNGIKHKLELSNNKIILTRENDTQKNIIPYLNNKKTISTFYLKDQDLTLELNIKTNNIITNEDIIQIEYQVLESKTNYIYKIEVDKCD